MLSFSYLQSSFCDTPLTVEHIVPPVKKVDSKAVKVLKKAKELIQYGWCQNKYHKRNWLFMQQYCVVGALKEAVRQVLPKKKVVQTVDKFRHLFTEYISPYQAIEFWNDSKNTNKSKVLNVLDVVIDKVSYHKS